MAIVLDASTPLSLAEILGSALTAVIDAQAQSARASVEFIKEVGLVAGSPDEQEKLRTVLFRYRKLDENQLEADFQVEIPLLGMVDIPMVSVKSASFSFNYDISETAPSEKPAAPSTNKFLSALTAPARIKGRVSKGSQITSSEKASLQVRVELEKSPMPIGIEKILDILEVAAAERKAPKP